MLSQKIIDRKISQNKYKSVEYIYKFIINILLVGHIISFVLLVIFDLGLSIYSLIVLIFSFYIKYKYNEKFQNLVSLWFHINTLILSAIFTYKFGWNSGFWYFVFGLIFISYFCAFDNLIFTYSLSAFETIFIVSLYFFTKDKINPNIDATTYQIMYITCFTITFFIVFRMYLFASIITSQDYKSLIKEQLELEKISQYDQLTGILNRRSMQKLVEKDEEFIKKNKIKTNSVLLLGDIDDFKHINDTFGHIYGDKIIKDVSSTLKNTFRKNDLVCRWGGEEFLIVLNDVNVEFIYDLSDRLLKNISLIKLPNNNPITMTFGMVVNLNSTSNSFEDNIKKADELLYKGKRDGKDKVEIEIIR
ncbi:GGDEF domain-containing protein [Campylobacter pinnipediorum]|uniref:GGDEF domain-containing protein n=1 Tax=Campylobacter pinnipediorum TaxID=1965231 RepID=UPI00084DFC56|nr:GGDEF domain-containing protein [Campylobacter pinnipediorum]